MQAVAFGCIVAVVWFGGNRIITGDMYYGSLTAFLNYIMQILMSLGMVAMVFVMLVLSRASAERIAEVMREVPDIADNPSPEADRVVDGSVDFEGVDFSYSKNAEVLNLEDINLHISPGEMVGIIGGTGSAKSSLVQLIPRLYDVLDGCVKVGGVDVRHYRLKDLRDAVAMVLQKNVLFSGTIKDNLRWGNPDATDEEIEHAARAAQAHAFITSFPDGYETELGQGGVNVSGGQKQRLPFRTRTKSSSCRTAKSTPSARTRSSSRTTRFTAMSITPSKRAPKRRRESTKTRTGRWKNESQRQTTGVTRQQVRFRPFHGDIQAHPRLLQAL